jgi:hypothetical protein
MAMVKRASRVLFLGAVTVAVTGLAAGPALAVAATWTVKPGGAVMTTSAAVTLTDTTAGSSVSCASSSVTGSLKAGSGLPGSGIGKITSWTFPAGCAPGGFTLTASHFPWVLNAVSFNSATGVTTGTITGIHAVLGGPCSAIIDGTSAIANNGKVAVTYTNSTGKLRVLTAGSNLHFYMSTCGGVHSGDHATLSASYTVVPRQIITSP